MREQIWAAVVAERGRAERVARARCATPQDAEDCVQEAMARVVAMPTVDPARIGPLLATVTANLAADTHRRRARAARVEPRLRAWAVPELTPEEVVCDAEEARWLWKRRQALGAQDRAVLEQRAQGRSVAEAAAELGLTDKAAEGSFTRARTRMRAIWQATAAAFGILWGRPQRTSSAAGPAVLAAATVALAFALLPGTPDVARSSPRAPTPQPADSVALAHGPAGRAPALITVPAVAARPINVSAAQPATSTQIARRDRTQVGIVAVGGTTVTREREQESLPQTLERCLREGLIVSISEIDCAG